MTTKNSLSIEVVRDGSFICSLPEIEKKAIEVALNMFPNKNKAAEALGIGRSTLYLKIEKYELCPEKRRQRILAEQLERLRQEREAHEVAGTLLVAA